MMRDGSIPAWAGKPKPDGAAVHGCRVYPRVGGETDGACMSDGCIMGLSPRGRGNLGNRFDGILDVGSIPAWAGKPIRGKQPVRGSIPAWAGKPMASNPNGLLIRVYPRVGGETSCRCSMRAWAAGLSPRGRGNPRLPRRSRLLQGSIPAWAGKPCRG